MARGVRLKRMKLTQNYIEFLVITWMAEIEKNSLSLNLVPSGYCSGANISDWRTMQDTLPRDEQVDFWLANGRLSKVAMYLLLTE